MEKKYRNFFKARQYVRNLELKNYNQWKAFAKSKFLPSDIPSNPEIYSEWKSYENWLGVEGSRLKRLQKEAKEFREAKGYRFELQKKLGSNPKFRPDAQIFDKKGNLVGILEFKKNYQVDKKNFFNQLRNYAQKLNLKNRREWREHFKNNIQRLQLGLTNPDISYKDSGWISWGDFLGNYNLDKKNRKENNYLGYEESSWLIQKINEKHNIELRKLNEEMFKLTAKLKVSQEEHEKKFQLMFKKRMELAKENLIKFDKAKKEQEWRKNKYLKFKIEETKLKEREKLEKNMDEIQKSINKLKNQYKLQEESAQIRNAIDWRKFYIKNKEKLKIIKNNISAVVPFRPEKKYLDKWKGFKNWSGYNLDNLNNQVLREWNFEKNKKNNIFPKDLSPNSNVRVWWNCNKGHIWMESVTKRISSKVRCPQCSFLKRLKEK